MKQKDVLRIQHLIKSAQDSLSQAAALTSEMVLCLNLPEPKLSQPPDPVRKGGAVVGLYDGGIGCMKPSRINRRRKRGW